MSQHLMPRIAPRKVTSLREYRGADVRGRRGTRDEVRLLDVVGVVFKRRWLLAGIVTVSVAAAAAYSLLATPLYEARATMLIEAEAPAVVNFRPVVAENEQRDVDYYETQYQVLRSRAIAAKALDRANLWGDPSFGAQPDAFSRIGGLFRRPATNAATPIAAPRDAEAKEYDRQGQIGALLGSLSVNPVKESRVVEIKFRSPNPVIASRVANGIAQAYIDNTVEVRRQRSEEASRWLGDRLRELREQVDSREGALQRYRERKDAVGLEDQQNIVVQKLAQLNAAVTVARTERIEKQTLYEQLQAAEASGAALDTLPNVLGNPLIQRQEADLAALQSERAQLAQQLGNLHPDLIKIDAAIAAAQTKLKAQIGQVAESVKNDFRAAQARERGLIGALESQKQEVLNLNRQSIGYGPLKRDAETTQQLFEGLLQRVKEAELSGELETSNARVLDLSMPPRGAVWPRTSIDVAVAFFGALFAGIGLIVGIDYLNPRIISADDVRTLGLPLLGITPRLRLPGGRIDRLDDNTLPAVYRESFRTLRATIMLSPQAGTIHTLAVTSASAREGKTVVASHLAVSMALAGRRVLLVDGDMRRPRIHRIFDIPRSPGFTEVIKGTATIDAVLRPSGVPGLSILPAGEQSDEVAEMLNADAVKKALAASDEVFDLLVIDSPPAMAVADASIIANAASAVLFVVAADATAREVAQAAVDRLVAAHARIIGVVLNKADLDRHADHYYPYFRRSDAAYYIDAPPRQAKRPRPTTIDT